jgi:predicted aldo/keto reductase-like oxidoreductase
MQYRKFGKLDWQCSALGFGAMRLPVKGKDPTGSDIDEPLAVEMIRLAIDRGVNYLDTAYPYHGGQSEIVVGRALRDGYRQKIRLATKLPSWLVKTADDFDRILNEQLEKLQTERIDFYLLHGLNRFSWPKLRELSVLPWAERVMAEGKIGHLGFSFHDDLEVFRQIVDDYDRWTFCQIQYNYMDIEFQAGTKGLKYAADRGLAVVIMEPLRGGQLSKEPPETVKAIWESSPKRRSPADWALQWLWNQPEVSIVLSGMTALKQVEENLASAGRSAVGSIDDQDLAMVAAAREKYRQLSPIPCTGCNYCLPCPNKVNIPHAFRHYNDAMMYSDPRTARFRYRQESKKALADQCLECGECEEKCPQKIPIAEWLKKVHEYLGPRDKG